MTDKDSQLDEIERTAALGSAFFIPDIFMFRPGGVYYEMRRENEKLFCDTGKGCSVCGTVPVVNVSGTYWLCGKCVDEKTEESNEMRRENERLTEIAKVAKKLNHAEQMIIGQANRSQPYNEWQLERNKWMEQLDEILNPDTEKR